MGKRKLVDLLCLSSWCLAIVVWLLLTMPRVSLQFEILVFPDHTHLLFLDPRSPPLKENFEMVITILNPRNIDLPSMSILSVCELEKL